MKTFLIIILSIMCLIFFIDSCTFITFAWRHKKACRKLRETLQKIESDTPSTIILPGMPGLEWMTENLSGFGGTEIDGRWYYTWDEAMAAAEQLGNGWRLPTRGELVDLDDLGSTWDDERKGRWFGGNHHTDHSGSLFLPASGHRGYTSGDLWGVGTHGYAWSSSPTSGSTYAGYLGFYSALVYPLTNDSRAYGFPVRCVRNVK